MIMKRRAISYLRMSTDRQLDGHSLARQTQATKAYCEANNLDLVEELEDIGVSGYSGANSTKGQLGVFFQALRNGEVEPNTILIVESLDRLSRQDPLTAMSQFSEMLSYGVELHTLFDKQVYSKESVGANAGQLFLSIGAMVRAFEESETKSKRLKAVWASKKKDQTQIVTSQVPFWIKVNKNTNGKAISFELRPDEAHCIRTIFDLSINQNLGSQAITSYLNSNKDRFPRHKASSRNKDNGWSESYIKSVFNNPAVYGVYQPHKRVNGKRVPDGEPFNNYYPTVISEEEFLLNKSRIAQRKIKGGGRKSVNFNNLFRGLLYCRSCGSKISFKDNVANKGGSILRCDLAKQRRANCNSLPIRYQPFEDLFFMAFQDVDFVTAISSNDFKGKERALELQITKIEEELSRTKKQLDVLVEELSQPDQPQRVKEILRTKLNDLSEVEEGLTKQHQDLKDELLLVGNSNVGGLFEDVRSLLDGVDGDRLFELRSSINVGLHKVIDRIGVDNSPEFFKEDVEDGLLEEDQLNRDFLEWFYSTRTDRWLIKDPLVYVASKVGYKMHQNFRTLTYVWMKSDEVRIVMPDGGVTKLPGVPSDKNK